MSLLPPAYLAKKLTRPLQTKDGATLRTIGEAADYVLALPPERRLVRQRWRLRVHLLGAQGPAKRKMQDFPTRDGYFI